MADLKKAELEDKLETSAWWLKYMMFIYIVATQMFTSIQFVRAPPRPLLPTRTFLHPNGRSPLMRAMSI